MAKTEGDKPAKTQNAAGAEADTAESRQSAKSEYRSFRLQKRIRGDRLPSAFVLMKSALVVLARNWKLFLTVVLIYGALNFVLVQGLQFVTGGVSDTKAEMDQLFSEGWGQLLSGLTVYVFLLQSSGGSSSSPTAGVYQSILILIVSLAVIWLLRQVHAGHPVRARDGFYQGMSPLVQFVLVLMTVAIQLIPMAIGSLLYSTVVSTGIAATGVEQILWALLAFLLAILSLYMVTSSLFALYIVTLPDMTPLRALRSARQLVAHRRWAVMRKTLFLPLAGLVMVGVIVLPFILFVTPLAAWVFLLLGMLFIPVTHSYLYTLYRSML